MRSLALALLALLATPTAGAIFWPGGEVPQHGTCDASGYLLCAGVDAGGAVTCDVDSTGHASCSYMWGYLAGGWSPAGLPGTAHASYRTTLRACDASGCADTDLPTEDDECAFVGPTSCVFDVAGTPGAVVKQLALGECLTVRVLLEGSADAATPDPEHAILEESYHRAGEADGQACFVDNGR